MTGQLRWARVLVLLLLSVTTAAAQSDGIRDQIDDDLTDELAHFDELSRAFRSVYDRVAPAVVLIRTFGTVEERRLPRFHPPVEPRQDPRFGPDDGGEFSGLGSGVIVSTDGYILSNYHVIQNADSIQVTLQDRRRLAARVVGVDSLIDIALLKVEGHGLPTAPLGQSTGLQVGEWVLAIGFPLGMGTTLTHGIVTALGRQAEVIQDAYRIESFIQTNAVINPGNSGGPLLDLRGRIVGINTAISTKTGYFMGYGLAVPIDLARESMDDFLEYGRVVRGYLGIHMSEVDARLARRKGLQLNPLRGVFIGEIDADTPAARSDLVEGDVVLSIDGTDVNEPNQIQTLINSRDPGDSVTLVVQRADAQHSISVVLGEREQQQVLARGHQRVEQLGLTVAPLTEERALEADIARQLGRQQSAGVVVVDIDPHSPAARRGLRVDDIITEIDRADITSVESFVRTVARLESGQSALFWFWRHDTGMDVRSLPIAASGQRP